MRSRAATTPLQREQRKQNLLLASYLARGQALIAIDEIGGRADALADVFVRVRNLLSSPLVRIVGSAVGAFVLVYRLRGMRGVGLVGWILPTWRVWRTVAAAIAEQRARATPGGVAASRVRGSP